MNTIKHSYIMKPVYMNPLNVLGKLEGIEEGMEKGLLMAAKNLKQAGIDNATIASATGLSIEQITQL
jgi:predicted transposase/invertase (TIGR01784 family)